MQGADWLRVIRGLAYRIVWGLLYVSHLALAFVSFAGFLGVAVFALDANGGASNTAGRRVTVAERCGMGLVSGSLGLAAAAGSRLLLRSHPRINPLYPEMQIGFTGVVPRRASGRPVRARRCTIATSTEYRRIGTAWAGIRRNA